MGGILPIEGATPMDWFSVVGFHMQLFLLFLVDHCQSRLLSLAGLIHLGLGPARHGLLNTNKNGLELTVPQVCLGDEVPSCGHCLD